MRLYTLLHIITLLLCLKSPVAPLPATVSPPTGLPDSAIKYYLALGDSYTIGQSVAVKDRFPVQTISQLRTAGFQMADAEIIATSGWTTTNLQHAISETSFTHDYDMVSILIGVNDQFQGRQAGAYRQSFMALLKKAIKLAGNRPGRVFVLSIPDYSVTPFAIRADKLKIARQINLFNQVNSQAAKLCQVHYLNITHESRKAASDPSLIAYDGLHFSGREYGIWSSLLTQQILQCLR